jgi:hypothetical protein
MRAANGRAANAARSGKSNGRLPLPGVEVGGEQPAQQRLVACRQIIDEAGEDGLAVGAGFEDLAHLAGGEAGLVGDGGIGVGSSALDAGE